MGTAAQKKELSQALMLLHKEQLIALVPNLRSPDVPGLKLPETFTASCAGQDFWEL